MTDSTEQTCKTLTRQDLALELSRQIGFPISECQIYVECVLTHFCNAIARDAKLNLKGFGIFSVHGKRARIGRNPKTGENHTIAARRVVRFAASTKILKKIKAQT